MEMTEPEKSENDLHTSHLQTSRQHFSSEAVPNRCQNASVHPMGPHRGSRGSGLVSAEMLVSDIF